MMESVSFKFDSGKNIFFTSDTHFSHSNIIEFCKRPFRDADHMNEELIKAWNEKVGPDDIVFHLGDFAWGGSSVWNDILSKLNGNIYLILGNHDIKNIRQGYINKFKWVGQQVQVIIEDQPVYLNHYPFLCYGGSYRIGHEVWQLFGHVHSGPNSSGLDTDRLQYLFPTQYDVGVDNNNYAPISWEEVKQKISDAKNKKEI